MPRKSCLFLSFFTLHSPFFWNGTEVFLEWWSQSSSKDESIHQARIIKQGKAMYLSMANFHIERWQKIRITFWIWWLTVNKRGFWIPSASLQEAFWIWQFTYRKNVELLWKNSKNSIMHSQDKRNIFIGMWAEDASLCFERVSQLLWVLTAFIGQVTGGLWVLCLLKGISFRVKHVYGNWNCRNKHFLCRWQYLASGNKKKNPFLRIHNRAFVQIVVSISPLGSFCNMFVFSW